MKKWFPAWFAATRYVAYNVALAYSGWLVAVKDQWEDLSSWDRANLSTILTLAALTALGAVMNGSWNEARKGDKHAAPR